MRLWCAAALVAGLCVAGVRVAPRAAGGLEEYRRLAEGGSVQAERITGEFYLSQRRVADALLWLRRAAEHGDIDAQVAVGDLYLDGPSVLRDTSAAARWYERAASSESAEALWKLGRLYENGEGVEADAEKAVELYQRAATLGSAQAQNSLGNLSLLASDHAGAQEWYRRAAEQGLGEAYLNLAGMYVEGLGVARDYTEALRLARVALDLQTPDAKPFLEEILRRTRISAWLLSPLDRRSQ